MHIPLQEATEAEGSAAAQSSSIAQGFVLKAEAMTRSLDERQEQLQSLIHALSKDNASRLAEDLKRTILTVHVPEDVEDSLEDAFNKLQKPILMRLSPIGGVKNPLRPTIIMSLQDKKSCLDALRMLYAEMFTEENLAVDKDTRTAVIIQSMPNAISTYRIINTGEFTIVEAQQGFGAWVEYGEADRFLFQNEELVKTEPGTSKGIFGKELRSQPRIAINDVEAREAFTYAKQFFPKSPLLIAKLADKSFVCLGSSAALPS